MLSASGYQVIDLGVNVVPMDAINEAERAGASIIGLSALMTTSMPYQKEVVSLLTELDRRDDYWVIVGGESGPGARPMDPAWVRSIRRQCRRQRVPFFFKQWGGIRKKIAGRELDGRTYDALPDITPGTPPGRPERRRRAELLDAHAQMLGDAGRLADVA